MYKSSYKSLISADGRRVIKIRPNYSKKTLTVITCAEQKSYAHNRYVIELSADDLENAYRNWSFNDCRSHLSYLAY